MTKRHRVRLDVSSGIIESLWQNRRYRDCPVAYDLRVSGAKPNEKSRLALTSSCVNSSCCTTVARALGIVPRLDPVLNVTVGEKSGLLVGCYETGHPRRDYIFPEYVWPAK